MQGTVGINTRTIPRKLQLYPATLFRAHFGFIALGLGIRTLGVLGVRTSELMDLCGLGFQVRAL